MDGAAVFSLAVLSKKSRSGAESTKQDQADQQQWHRYDEQHQCGDAFDDGSAPNRDELHGGVFGEQYCSRARSVCTSSRALVFHYKPNPEVRTSSTAARKRRQTIPVYRPLTVFARQFRRQFRRQVGAVLPLFQQKTLPSHSLAFLVPWRFKNLLFHE